MCRKFAFLSQEAVEKFKSVFPNNYNFDRKRSSYGSTSVDSAMFSDYIKRTSISTVSSIQSKFSKKHSISQDSCSTEPYLADPFNASYGEVSKKLKCQIISCKSPFLTLFSINKSIILHDLGLQKVKEYYETRFSALSACQFLRKIYRRIKMTFLKICIFKVKRGSMLSFFL